MGTTGRGVGPAYVDKTARMGIRVGELLNHDALLSRLKHVLDIKNSLLTKVYQDDPISIDQTYKQCIQWGQALESRLRPTEVLLRDALSQGDKVLLEGAQGTMLDLDHGTYPYVTSSSSSVGGTSTGRFYDRHSYSILSCIFRMGHEKKQE